ncbi:high mobility group protein B3-like [Xyrichtys novacula]|uniref:High mobility group protein B3-like n=1 Tax=Xyrichtys novacula TaxID=13765 RepID=A0AAV1EHY4_XYRNO|nr:high mobility group protein B3-like [Xyrichtys novacula]
MGITNGGVAGGRGRAGARPSLKVNQRLQSELQPPNNNKNPRTRKIREPIQSLLQPEPGPPDEPSTCREEHRKKNPEQSVNFAEFSKKCSERWKALSASDKKCFEDMAKADKVRYNREMRDYVPPKGFGKRGRKRKDPNAPKRPPSAFFVFCSEYRPSVKQQYPGLSIGDCAKKLGEMWSKLSQSEKQPYEEKAQKLREKYDRDMVAYRGGGTYARNPGSSAQGGEDEEEEEGEDEDEDEDEDE